MLKTNKFAHAAQIVALSLGPVLVSLIGLAALSRKNRDRRTPPEGKSQARSSTRRPTSPIGDG